MDGYDENTRLIRSTSQDNDRVRHIRGVVPTRTADYARRQTSTRKHESSLQVYVACGIILIACALERMSFYGLTGNLVLFLNMEPYGWKSYHAINASLFVFGITCISSFFGGWIADTFLGRFKAILISLIVYIAGYVMVTIASPTSNAFNKDASTYSGMCAGPSHGTNHSHGNHSDWEFLLSDADIGPFSEHCAGFIYPALLVVAVGTGVFRTNIPPFGADQLSEEGQETTLVFFNWFYWCVNIGALVGLVALTYVEQQMSFFYGYVVGCSGLALALILLVLAGCSFQRKPPEGSVLTKIFKIINEARRKKRKRQHARHVNQQHGLQVDEADSVQTQITFLDYAKHRHGGIFHESLVEDVKVLKKILAVFVVLIPYWIVYFQMQTTFLDQGLHMRMDFVRENNSTNSHPQVVAAWLTIFDVVVVICLLPLMDRGVYPWLERCGYQVGFSWRMGLGMLFSTSAMLVAGVVEHFRLHHVHPNSSDPCEQHVIYQIVAGTNYSAADMSIFWQIPQYTLIGISEVFTSVAGVQFACSVAPRSMKSIMMGLFNLFSGLGSLLGTAILSTLTSLQIWFNRGDHGDINTWCSDDGHLKTASHLDYYFYLLAGISFLGFLGFLLVAKTFALDSELAEPPPKPPPRAFLDSASGVHREAGPTSTNSRPPRTVQIQRNLSAGASI